MLYYIRLTAVLILFLWCFDFSFAATPPLWPEQFQMGFITRQTNHGADGRGWLYYSANLKSQRIDHSGYNLECSTFYKINGACSLFFTPKGFYVLEASTGKCCKDPSGVVSVPRDWLAKSGAVQNDTTLETINGINYTVNHWKFPTVPEHTYWSVADSNIPFRFSFPSPEQTQWFLPETFSYTMVNPMLFVVPACCDTACQSSFMPYFKYIMQV